MTTETVHPHPSNEGISRRVNIIPLGFSSADLERLVKIFEHAPAGHRGYLLLPSSHNGAGDILLVNHDDPAAIRESFARRQSSPLLPMLAVSRGPLTESVEYHLQGMLIGVKVLALLDKIPLPASCAADHPAHNTASADMDKVFRVLVVDDSVAIQKSLEIHLKRLPQVGDIDFAKNGEEALEFATKNRYDLVFLDVVMPGIDGYESCAQLRKLPQYKKTPIIMVSGNSEPVDEVRGVIAGCTTYLTKPVQTEAFLKLSLRVLQQAASNRGFF